VSPVIIMQSISHAEHPQYHYNIGSKFDISAIADDLMSIR
jgi:hypothetical protein